MGVWWTMEGESHEAWNIDKGVGMRRGVECFLCGYHVLQPLLGVGIVGVEVGSKGSVSQRH